MATPLRHDVLERLDLLERAASRGDARTLLPLARTELRRLAEGWRRMLAVHQPDEDGRCTTCLAWLRRRRWPCQIWVKAHLHLIGDGIPHRTRRTPLRNPFRKLAPSASEDDRNLGVARHRGPIDDAPTTRLTIECVRPAGSGPPRPTDLPAFAPGWLAGSTGRHTTDKPAPRIRHSTERTE